MRAPFVRAAERHRRTSIACSQRRQRVEARLVFAKQSENVASGRNVSSGAYDALVYSPVEIVAEPRRGDAFAELRGQRRLLEQNAHHLAFERERFHRRPYVSTAGTTTLRAWCEVRAVCEEPAIPKVVCAHL